MKETRIQRFYSGKNVLITGVTGSVGKVLLERLLFSCPNVGKIYLLVREKKGKSPQERLNAFLDDKVFSKLNDGWRKKIVGVNGDLTNEKLSLSEKDRSLLVECVNVVFHSAATVRFDERLKMALETNVLGTTGLIRLCEQMKDLEAFVHISTAYSYCLPYDPWIKETLPHIDTPSLNLDEVRTLCQMANDEPLEILKPKLFKDWPNSYSFSKAIAERVVFEQAKCLPVAIFKPGIVMGTSGRHTMPGYVDTFYGPSGVLAAIGFGVLRVLNIQSEFRTNMLPSDYCANAILTIGWDVAEQKRISPTFINYLPPEENNVTWKRLEQEMSIAVEHSPLSKAIWYPMMTYVACKYDYQIRQWFVHLLPAFVIDVALKMAGVKLRLLDAYKKIYKIGGLSKPFMAQNWRFELREMGAIRSLMDDDDRRLLYCNLADLSWKEYTPTMIDGIKRYLLDDPITPQALSRHYKLKILHYSFKIVVLFFSFWLFLYFVNSWISQYL